MERPTKPKRKLSDIKFDQEGAHVALVSKDQGGGANGHNYVMAMKANNFTEDFVEKVQQVRVTMELPDFLERFFCMMEDDADALAYMMGYVETPETQAMEQEEADAEFQDWVKSKMDSFEILQSLHEADNLTEALSKLDQEEYLSMLKNQQQIEKVFKKLDRQTKSKPVVKKTTSLDTSVSNEVNKEGVSAPVVKQTKKKESNMEQEVHVVEHEVEMVAKSAYTDLQKALDEQKAELKKALDIVAALQAEKQEQVAKARKAQVLDAVKDEDKAEVLFKAVGKAEDADFEAVVKALKELASAVDNSDLFVEKGATVEVQDDKQESAVARLIKAKLQANTQSK